MKGPGRAEWAGSLEGCVTVVSGGSGGLGRGVVKVLLEAGAELHLPIYDSDELPELESYLGDALHGLHLHEGIDLTVAGEVARLMEAVKAKGTGAPEAVVNLAGGFGMSPVEETDPELWEHLWAMNATTAFLMSRAAFPAMKRAGRGRIVNISALPALQGGQSGLSAYGAAKAAVLNLTRTLAKEGVEAGITVNAVLPSIIDTPGNREAMPDADSSRWLPPVEIARVIRFLLSNEGSIVNGAAIPLTLGPP